MNAAHIHLVLVHIPVVLIPLSALLLAWGLVRTQPSVRRVGLGIALVASLVSVPAYLAGEGAEDIVEDRAGVSERAIEEHEEAAEIAFWLSLLLLAGSLATFGLEARRHALAGRAYSGALAIALLCSGSLGYAANLGGRIRHPEAFQAPSVAEKGRLVDHDDD